LADHRDVLSSDLFSHGSHSSASRGDLLKLPFITGADTVAFSFCFSYFGIFPVRAAIVMAKEFS